MWTLGPPSHLGFSFFICLGDRGRLGGEGNGSCPAHPTYGQPGTEKARDGQDRLVDRLHISTPTCLALG